jgi:hypothetical protein
MAAMAGIFSQFQPSMIPQLVVGLSSDRRAMTDL